MLRKIKPNLTDQEYKRLYPSGSAPGKFYGTAKFHEISINDGVDKLIICPIISNIGNTYLLTYFCHHWQIRNTLLQVLRVSLKK